MTVQEFVQVSTVAFWEFFGLALLVVVSARLVFEVARWVVELISARVTGKPVALPGGDS